MKDWGMYGFDLERKAGKGPVLGLNFRILRVASADNFLKVLDISRPLYFSLQLALW